MKVGASDRGFAATSPKSKPCFKEWCRPMLGMGGAARQTIHDEAVALQVACNYLIVG